MSEVVEIKVPDIGDFDSVEVIELLVKPGDVVRAEQSLITVESDKASMEIPSAAAGIVREIRVALGDKVAQGSVVLMLDTEAGPAVTAPGASDAAPSVSADAGWPAPVIAGEDIRGDRAWRVDIKNSRRYPPWRKWRCYGSPRAPAAGAPIRRRPSGRRAADVRPVRDGVDR